MVTDDELLKRLDDHEDNFTERKSEGVKPADLRKTLCAFANSLDAPATAVLFIGVNDKTGAIPGVNNTDATQMRVREAADDCYPPITFGSRVLNVHGASVVAVMIESSQQRPHFTGAAYVRRGSESVNASAEALDQLIASRNQKAGRLQSMAGKKVSIISHGYMLEKRREVGNREYKERAEGTVTSCDAHVVTLEISNLGVRSFPLEHVQIDYDDKHSRDCVVIRYTP